MSKSNRPEENLDALESAPSQIYDQIKVERIGKLVPRSVQQRQDLRFVQLYYPTLQSGVKTRVINYVGGYSARRLNSTKSSENFFFHCRRKPIFFRIFFFLYIYMHGNLIMMLLAALKSHFLPFFLQIHSLFHLAL